MLQERSDDEGSSEGEVLMTKSNSSRPRPAGGKAPVVQDQPRSSSLEIQLKKYSEISQVSFMIVVPSMDVKLLVLGGSAR